MTAGADLWQPADGQAWKVVGIGDLGDDRHSESFWQIAIWDMNGTSVVGGGVASANPGPGWRAIGTGGEAILFQNTGPPTPV